MKLWRVIFEDISCFLYGSEASIALVEAGLRSGGEAENKFQLHYL